MQWAKLCFPTGKADWFGLKLVICITMKMGA